MLGINTEDITGSFSGKGQKLHLKSITLPIYLAKSPTETLQKAHPACDFVPNMVLLLWILHQDVSQVHGRYQAPDLLTHLHQHPIWLYGQHCALRSPNRRCHHASRMVSSTS